MKLFQQKELREAYLFAETGGQALHVISGSFAYVRPGTPAVFKNRQQIAHLIDNDHDRLWATAKRLGVRVIKVERIGRVGQHIDLTCRPLDRALEECSQSQLPIYE